MAEIKVSAVKRELGTKGALNQLRKDDKVPGVFYVKGEEPILFYAETTAINPLVYTAENHICLLSVDGGEEQLCILKDVQFDPVSEQILHVDFLGLTAGQELTLQIPVSYIGQAVGVKSGGTLAVFLHKLDVQCLPKHIPEHVEVDVTSLNVGQSIHVRDLSFENLKIMNGEDVLVVAVQRARGMDEQAEEEGEEPATAEPEVISKGKSEEEE